ncbi:hypothetical protein [Roseateles sp. P5_E1]
MSKRQERQRDRMPLDVRLISEIRAIADRPFVLGMEDHLKIISPAISTSLA